MLIALMYLTEEYKRDQVSMKDQDSLWIISTLNWYYKFSKSIVISVFTHSYYYYFLHNLYGDCARHPTSPTGRTDLLHV